MIMKKTTLKDDALDVVEKSVNRIIGKFENGQIVSYYEYLMLVNYIDMMNAKEDIEKIEIKIREFAKENNEDDDAYISDDEFFEMLKDKKSKSGSNKS